MRGAGFFAAVLLAVSSLSCVPAQAQTSASAGAAPSDIPEEGLWLSEEHDGLFSIEPCGHMLCGQLIGMAYDGAVPKDVWGRSQCGIRMLTDFVPIEDRKWQGHILDPRTGRVYQARIWVSEPNVLKLRGFVLGMPLLGETQTWTRYAGPPVGPQCKLPKDAH
ncbi:DUF2147 domain-containing protein [Gluconobacter oxydans]|uniref:DUF2147 domain-containing protein n=2 Tax=Gluconobacter oxydans TaxID=442 RepID=A0A149RRZ6_GLUOY|nr:DUF2147 domain-containing protein [Gluconobacter oxydans]AHK69976.1 putative DUF2147 family protein [Gluconobacter oxydans DSM 3504]KXV08836.1 hypothetical protein AD931_05720 [Gluconobacter oxydans]KXV11296.1 hypothetical protein AD932_12605 [Gluconobacter oxydans]KXV17170.1 hypothetical protein AD934_12990 [Gluconobacter oxydans]KXV64849.1 hypothetical protein AD950_07430 [Gluconobacter oxydans]